jgi:transmembrane 9 superfamily protein 2/4
VLPAFSHPWCCRCCAGEVLRGDRIENSLYNISMRVDEQCKVLCKVDSLNEAQARAFRNKIDDDYKVNM